MELCWSAGSSGICDMPPDVAALDIMQMCKPARYHPRLTAASCAGRITVVRGAHNMDKSCVGRTKAMRGAHEASEPMLIVSRYSRTHYVVVFLCTGVAPTR
jgi:hypothetical protein